jgi:hypothetical protein
VREKVHIVLLDGTGYDAGEVTKKSKEKYGGLKNDEIQYW